MLEKPILVIGPSSLSGSGLQNLWKALNVSFGLAALRLISSSSSYPVNLKLEP